MTTLGMNIYINNPFISIKKSSDETKKKIDNEEVFHLSDNVASWQALPKKALTGSGTGHKRQ
jgi:hypothetical protein